MTNKETISKKIINSIQFDSVDDLFLEIDLKIIKNGIEESLSKKIKYNDDFIKCIFDKMNENIPYDYFFCAIYLLSQKDRGKINKIFSFEMSGVVFELKKL